MDIEKSTKKASANHVVNVPTLYPDERLIAFLKRSFTDIDCFELKAIDIGYGGGRNLKLLLDMGFQCYGIEYIPEAEVQAKQNLKEQASLVEFYQGDFTKYDFQHSFDVIVSWGVFPHMKKNDIINNLNLVYDLLSDNGKFVLNFRTKNNWFLGKGEKLGDGSFLLDESAREYQGYYYSFLDENEINNIINDTAFSIAQKERLDLWKNDASEQHSWIILELQK